MLPGGAESVGAVFTYLLGRTTCETDTSDV